MNLLMRYEGYVDLTQSLPNIRKNVRKSYKSLINKGFKNYEFTYFDSKTFLMKLVRITDYFIKNQWESYQTT